MIDRGHDLPVVQQAKALGISRGSVYYLPRPVSDDDLAVRAARDKNVTQVGCGSKGKAESSLPDRN